MLPGDLPTSDGVFLIVVIDDGVDVRKVYRMLTRSPLRDCLFVWDMTLQFCIYFGSSNGWSCCGTKDLFTSLGARGRD